MDTYFFKSPTITAFLVDCFDLLESFYFRQVSHFDEIDFSSELVGSVSKEEELDELGEADANYITYINVLKNYFE